MNHVLLWAWILAAVLGGGGVLRLWGGTLGWVWGLGLGSALVLIAEAYLDGRSAPRSHQPRSAAPWPAVAEGMAGPIDQMPHWPCHDPEMDVSRILRFCRLMSWTLAPASAAG